MGEEVNATVQSTAASNPFGEGFKEANAGTFIYWKTDLL